MKTIRSLVSEYRRIFREAGIRPVRCKSPPPWGVLNHCAWMVGEVDKMTTMSDPVGSVPTMSAIDHEFVRYLYTPDRETLQNAERWLGFVQGIFCAQGVFDFEQIRDQNRSGLVDGDPFSLREAM